MFLQLSVSVSVHRGDGACMAHTLLGMHTPRHARPPGYAYPPGMHPLGMHAPRHARPSPHTAPQACNPFRQILPDTVNEPAILILLECNLVF